MSGSWSQGEARGDSDVANRVSATWRPINFESMVAQSHYDKGKLVEDPALSDERRVGRSGLAARDAAHGAACDGAEDPGARAGVVEAVRHHDRDREQRRHHPHRPEPGDGLGRTIANGRTIQETRMRGERSALWGRSPWPRQPAWSPSGALRRHHPSRHSRCRQRSSTRSTTVCCAGRWPQRTRLTAPSTANACISTSRIRPRCRGATATRDTRSSGDASSAHRPTTRASSGCWRSSSSSV